MPTLNEQFNELEDLLDEGKGKAFSISLKVDRTLKLIDELSVAERLALDSVRTGREPSKLQKKFLPKLKIKNLIKKAGGKWKLTELARLALRKKGWGA